MVKRNGRRQSNRRIPTRRTYDPWVDIAVQATNRFVNFGTDYLLDLGQKKLGINKHSIKTEIEQNRVLCALEKSKAEAALARQREAEALEKAEQARFKKEREKQIHEHKIRLLELSMEEKQLRNENLRERSNSDQESQQKQPVHIRVEPICGALAVVASANGLTTSSNEQLDSCMDWLKNSNQGRVLIVLGARDSGKSAFIGTFAEFLRAAYGTQSYWVGLPEEAKNLLPHWIHIVDAAESCPPNSLILCDETGLNYLSFLFNTPKNRYLHYLLMLARHKQNTLVFAAQSSKDIDCSIVRQADSIIFKEQGINQAEDERLSLRRKAKEAAAAFSQIPKEKRKEAAFVFDHSFKGLLNSALPSFWSEEFSRVYQHVDLSRLEITSRGRYQLGNPILDTSAKTLDTGQLKKEIRQLREQGHGIEKIAKLCNCSPWTVRKCLGAP